MQHQTLAPRLPWGVCGVPSATPCPSLSPHTRTPPARVHLRCVDRHTHCPPSATLGALRHITSAAVPHMTSRLLTMCQICVVCCVVRLRARANLVGQAVVYGTLVSCHKDTRRKLRKYLCTFLSTNTTTFPQGMTRGQDPDDVGCIGPLTYHCPPCTSRTMPPPSPPDTHVGNRKNKSKSTTKKRLGGHSSGAAGQALDVFRSVDDGWSALQVLDHVQ